MLYIALISHDESVRNPETNERCRDPAFLTLVVDAQSVEDALDACRRKLLKLHDEDELLNDVYRFYLQDLVEIGEVGPKANLVNWFTVHPFGDSYSTLAYIDSDGNDSISHYGMNDMRWPMQSGFGRDASDLDDEEWHDSEPILDIDVDRHLSRPLFKDLLKQKMRGTLPLFEEMSDGDLFELFVIEGCIRKEIASLFDVPLNKLDSRRRRIGANRDESALYGVLVSQNFMDPIPYRGSEDRGVPGE